MTISKSDIEEAISYIDQAEDFRPVIRRVVELLLSYGPDMYDIKYNHKK